jgi:DNA-binding NarL/FixJ family response regulator
MCQLLDRIIGYRVATMITAQASNKRAMSVEQKVGGREMMQIVIGEHEEMLREGFVKILNAEQDMCVAGQAADGYEVIKLAAALKPQVVVMDADMPIANGLEATRRIRKRVDAPPVVLLSMSGGLAAVSKAMEAGASAHVGTDCTPVEFIATIRRAVSGEVTQSASMRRSEQSGNERPYEAEGVEALTPREREVLQLFSEGYASKEVGDTLNISIKTVSTHRVHIGEKLHTRSLAGMTKVALKAGLARL